MRLTSSLLLFLILIAYMLAPRYGGAGGRKHAAALALFAAVNVPLVYKSVDIWRTVHPLHQRRLKAGLRHAPRLLVRVRADRPGVGNVARPAHAPGGYTRRALRIRLATEDGIRRGETMTTKSEDGDHHGRSNAGLAALA